MKRQKALLLIVFSLLSALYGFAQSGGNSTYQFLGLTNPARVVALGGTFISVKDNDLNLSFQNPSLLDSTHHNSLSLSYIDYFTDMQYGYAAYSRSYRKLGSFSAGIQFADYGTFTSAEATGIITGTFKAAEYSLNLGYSRALDSNFSVGAAVKTIYSSLSEYASFGNALDLGAVYNNRKNFLTAGIVIKNMGKQWRTYDIVHEPLPFEIQMGVSKKIAHAPFRISLTAIHLEKWNLTYTDPLTIAVDPISGDTINKKNFAKFADKLARHFVIGTEILLSKNFHIRLGYNYLRRQELKLISHPGIAGFSFGFGLKVLKFHLSYGYSRYHMAGGPNHFTISSNLSEFKSKKK